jgi:hypothetical protein
VTDDDAWIGHAMKILHRSHFWQHRPEARRTRALPVPKKSLDRKIGQ